MESEEKVGEHKERVEAESALVAVTATGWVDQGETCQKLRLKRQAKRYLNQVDLARDVANSTFRGSRG